MNIIILSDKHQLQDDSPVLISRKTKKTASFYFLIFDTTTCDVCLRLRIFNQTETIHKYRPMDTTNYYKSIT